jgi:hypothetical protein
MVLTIFRVMFSLLGRYDSYIWDVYKVPLTVLGYGQEQSDLTNFS